jgi:hypothetical protein
VDGGLVTFKRAKRVRIHFQNQDPSLEGLLVSRGWPCRWVRVAVPQLLLAEGAEPIDYDSREVVIPRENIWHYEVL